MKRYPEYKESGVEWIGGIPKNWGMKRLKYVADLNMGQSPPSQEYNSDQIGTPFLQGNAEFGLHHPTPKIYCPTAKKYAIPGDILLSVRAPVGAINIANQEYGIGRGLCAIRPRANQFECRYAKYLLEVVRTELHVVATGTTYDAVTVDEVSNLTCVVPPIPTQTQIANFLDQKTGKIDELIRIKERQIELLQEQRTTLINQTVTKGLDPNVEMKPSRMEWIGDIPAHWEVINTKYLFQLVTEPAPKNNDCELLSIYTHIGVKPRKELEPKGNRATTTDGYWLVKKGDFIVNKLLAWMGAIGLSNYEGVTSPAYDILRKSRPLNERFYEYLFRCGLYFTEFKKRSRGIMEVRLRLYFDQFGQIPLVFPPVHEQDKITAFLDCKTGQIDELITAEQRKIELLKEYRQSLISEAVTGKIDVRNKV